MAITLTKLFDGGLNPDKPCVVGIDQSYTGFGLTFLSTEDDTYRTYVYKAPGSGVIRLNNIQEWLKARLGNFSDIQDVGLETPVKMSHSALMSGELYGAVRLVLLKELGMFPLQVPPTSLKKFVTGKGTGIQKNEMLLQTYKQFSVEFSDDNAADSYGIARIVRGTWDHKYQEEIIKKLDDPKFRDPSY